MNSKSILTGVLIAAQDHARACYPNVSLGYVKGNTYHELENVAQTRERFRLAFDASNLQPCSALIYSAPGGTMYPDQTDMEMQLEHQIPFGKIAIDEKVTGAPVFWGDDLPIEPIIGRSFIHGVWDCFSIVRDSYRLGADGMSRNDIAGWPYPPILLPEVPRSDDWWGAGQDLYMDHLHPAGFVTVSPQEVRVGDGFLLKIRSDKFNHAGVVVADNTILHHLPTRLSRRESAGMWARQVGLWVRYQGNTANGNI